MVKYDLLSWIHLEYLYFSLFSSVVIVFCVCVWPLEKSIKGYKTRLYNQLKLRAKKHTKRSADLHNRNIALYLVGVLSATPEMIKGVLAWLVFCWFFAWEKLSLKKHLKRSQRPIEIAAVARIYHFFGWICVHFFGWICVKKTPKAAVWQNSFARVFVPEKPTLLSRLAGYPLVEKRETNKHGSRLGEQMDGFHKDLEWTMMNPLVFSGMHMKSVLVITNSRPISG